MSDWKICKPIEALAAFEDKTHDIEGQCGELVWYRFDGRNLIVDGSWQYRIREKAPTITVTIPRPEETGVFGIAKTSIQIVFASDEAKLSAYNSIRAAMEQQQ